jgi:hypothetical protein
MQHRFARVCGSEFDGAAGWRVRARARARQRARVRLRTTPTTTQTTTCCASRFGSQALTDDLFGGTCRRTCPARSATPFSRRCRTCWQALHCALQRCVKQWKLRHGGKVRICWNAQLKNWSAKNSASAQAPLPQLFTQLATLVGGKRQFTVQGAMSAQSTGAQPPQSPGQLAQFSSGWHTPLPHTEHEPQSRAQPAQSSVGGAHAVAAAHAAAAVARAVGARLGRGAGAVAAGGAEAAVGGAACSQVSPSPASQKPSPQKPHSPQSASQLEQLSPIGADVCRRRSRTRRSRPGRWCSSRAGRTRRWGT